MIETLHTCNVVEKMIELKNIIKYPQVFMAAHIESKANTSNFTGQK